MNVKACRDHLGNEFQSVTAMCEYWGVNIDTFYARRGRGHSLEASLTSRGIRNRGDSNSIKCRDHLGNEFPSMKVMCEYWGVGYKTFLGRIERGYSIEKALTSSIKQGKACRDHLGNEFQSVTAMCEYWGVKPVTFQARRAKGYSIEQILAPPRKKGDMKACRDHLGNEFQSVTAMCEYWGVKPVTFQARRQRGYSLKDALTYSLFKRTPCKDHLGNEFPSIKAMCEYWGVDRCIFTTRRNKGYSLKECLTGRKKSK